MLTALTGINWGDEGKGRMVDLLCSRFDIVARYQGGNNAGHTVINELGEFVMNLLPSGVFHKNVVNVMGSGMVIDLKHLCMEIKKLRDCGIELTPDNLKISDRATICMPYHVAQDALEEARLGAHAYGSTKRGIAYVYGDKYMKKSLRMGDLLSPGYLQSRLCEAVEYKDLVLCGAYGEKKQDMDALKNWLDTYSKPLLPYICDVTAYLTHAQRNGKSIMFEAQLGALRDIDYGIYPYTSSSNTIASYAPIGAGIPGARLDTSIGIMKAYSSCVGEGPFTVEMFGPEADALREAGGEYGAATGRPRRVGAFDAVASRYGVLVQGAHELALTKLDVLSYLDRIPVCTKYVIDGVETCDFPVGSRLDAAKPVYEYMDGWRCDIGDCREFDQLPPAARDYVLALEKMVGCRIKYISVGARREAYIER